MKCKFPFECPHPFNMVIHQSCALTVLCGATTSVVNFLEHQYRQQKNYQRNYAYDEDQQQKGGIWSSCMACTVTFIPIIIRDLLLWLFRSWHVVRVLKARVFIVCSSRLWTHLACLLIVLRIEHSNHHHLYLFMHGIYTSEIIIINTPNHPSFVL